jgi:lecithin-cholesterol acyltransferase
MNGPDRGSRPPRVRLAVFALLAVALLVALPGTAAAAQRPAAPKTRLAPTPIVLFPAFHFTKLLVTVHNQTVDPACPRSGSFEDWFLIDKPSTTFSQVCRDELMTLRYDRNSHAIIRRRFHEQAGVSVSIIDYGRTSSAPFYEPMYQALEHAGYTRDQDIVVAGYDARLTPDMGDFARRTRLLIEQTYHANGDRPVHLVGHSNGPLYAQYLLTRMTPAWKHKYIHGFTPIAGNFPGQGALYPLLFTGLNVGDFTFPTTTANAVSSARMYLTAPSSYMSAADPDIFGTQETVVSDASTGRNYTPQDYPRLFEDAGVPWVLPFADRYIGFVKFADPDHFPNVDVYAEKGSGIDTLVGLGLHDLTIGQLLDDETTFLTRDGDINQEDITNNAVAAWKDMKCYRFSLTDNRGIDHFSLPSDPDVLARLIRNASRPRSDCK